MKIVFMGTPEFAVGSLQKLHQSKHEIAGIVTVPDKPKGRGQKVAYSTVKKYALEHKLAPVLQPVKLKTEDFIKEITKLNADLYVVVAFRILHESVFGIPKYGTINLHASLLPEYRGAAPINWAIMNGEEETGVTTFLLNKGVDTGQILLQEKLNINKDETAGELHDRLLEAGSELLLNTVNSLEEGTVTAKTQLEGSFKKAPKIDREVMEINWDKNVEEVKNQIHGLSPYPAAFTHYKDKKIKIFKTKVLSEKNDSSLEPGKILYMDKKSLSIQTANGQLQILELQFPGKRKISIEEAIRGYDFKIGEKFE
ncbi:MAG: methionyl-tRNA formyltransferase [Calditrichia bacterium]|nr:methionyl-tRNA formyltransferase [Calditrichia bacterium]